ncbi:MAG: hypothetical protein ACLFUI_02690 [Halanaerobiales bacterium]
MRELTTFEEVANKLYKDYRGAMVNITTRQAGITLASFQTSIENIEIKPLNKSQSKKWNKDGKKVGLIVVQDKHSRNNLNIPFILDFNTMKATFLKTGVVIKTLDMEFIIKVSKRKKKLA